MKLKYLTRCLSVFLLGAAFCSLLKPVYAENINTSEQQLIRAANFNSGMNMIDVISGMYNESTIRGENKKLAKNTAQFLCFGQIFTKHKEWQTLPSSKNGQFIVSDEAVRKNGLEQYFNAFFTMAEAFESSNDFNLDAAVLKIMKSGVKVGGNKVIIPDHIANTHMPTLYTILRFTKALLSYYKSFEGEKSDISVESFFNDNKDFSEEVKKDLQKARPDLDLSDKVQENFSEFDFEKDINFEALEDVKPKFKVSNDRLTKLFRVFNPVEFLKKRELGKQYFEEGRNLYKDQYEGSAKEKYFEKEYCDGLLEEKIRTLMDKNVVHAKEKEQYKNKSEKEIVEIVNKNREKIIRHHCRKTVEKIIKKEIEDEDLKTKFDLIEKKYDKVAQGLYEAAQSSYKAAEQLGNSYATTNLVTTFQFNKDYVSANKLLEIAVEKSNRHAIRMLALNYFYGRHGLEKNHKKSAYYFWKLYMLGYSLNYEIFELTENFYGNSISGSLNLEIAQSLQTPSEVSKAGDLINSTLEN